MGAQLRVYRRRIKAVQATKKITQRHGAHRHLAHRQGAAAREVVLALCGGHHRDGHDRREQLVHGTCPHHGAGESRSGGRAGDHQRHGDSPARTAAPRCAAPSSSTVRLREEGMDPVPYVVGRKGVAYYNFRNREIGQDWTGFSEQPQYQNAREIADTLIEAFLTGSEAGGIDEIHLVFTEFVSIDLPANQDQCACCPWSSRRQSTDEGPMPLYEFEPSRRGRARRAAAALPGESHLERAAAVGGSRSRRRAGGR